MFRIICAIAALFSLVSVSTANAQPRACKKVDVSFACRNGGSGTATFNCRGGETEAQCCARLRRRAADPRHGFCTGRAGGLVSFRCGCSRAGGGGGGLVEELRPLEGGEGGDRLRPLREADEPGRGRQGRLPGRARGDGRDERPQRCTKVRYAFSCRREGGASGQADCRSGNEARCCARVRRLAQESCDGKRGVARFRCECVRGPEGPRLLEEVR